MAWPGAGRTVGCSCVVEFESVYRTFSVCSTVMLRWYWPIRSVLTKDSVNENDVLSLLKFNVHVEQSTAMKKVESCVKSTVVEYTTLGRAVNWFIGWSRGKAKSFWADAVGRVALHEAKSMRTSIPVAAKRFMAHRCGLSLSNQPLAGRSNLSRTSLRHPKPCPDRSPERSLPELDSLGHGVWVTGSHRRP